VCHRVTSARVSAVSHDTPPTPLEQEKRVAAEAAALLVEDGMAVGLGTGSTVAHLLPALARRGLRLRCVATSLATEEAGLALGLDVEPFETLERLDIVIDGADQIAPDGWVIKGGGGAHVREKVVAAAADRFVVIGSSDKPVEKLTPPVPIEILAFGVAATLTQVAPASLRAVAPSPDGGLIADVLREFDDPATHARFLDAVPGIVGHGLFGPDLVTDLLVARGGDVEHRAI
jgi:ribose 5-phosphate isomerase A